MEEMIQTADEPVFDDNSSNLNMLNEGLVPEDMMLLRRITTGTEKLTDFLKRQYLQEYIPAGGSKIKFITGRKGCGKTHISRLLLDDAVQEGYITVSFSAKDVWLHDFREIYLEILRQCDLAKILQGCADQIIREMGYDPDDVPANGTFMDLLAQKQEADAISKSTIRSILRSWFTKNPLLDNMFAGCCSLLIGGLLGHPVLEQSNKELILAFLHGDKTVKLSQIRALGLAPARITKYNARHLLRSLAELIKISGKKGLLTAIDDMEILMNRGSGEGLHYTKLRREDTYESIRQLIDDIDSMRYVMFLMIFDRDLMDDESYGLKSYQALWMRIQSEVAGNRFNCFADILDLDRLADEVLTPEAIMTMSERICSVLQQAGYAVAALSEEKAKELIQRSQYGGIGLPYLVIRAIHEDA